MGAPRTYRMSLIVYTFCGIIACFLTEASGNFNIYLTTEEVKRIFGLEAEIYYVREGVINQYALNWSVTVQPEVSSLHFTWEAVSKRPVYYTMAVWVNNTETTSPHLSSPSLEALQGRVISLAVPRVNISLQGIIPREPSSFRLDLPCTGLVSSENDVILNINVTDVKGSKTPNVLFIKRRKICLEGTSAEIFSPHQDPDLGVEAQPPPLSPLVIVIITGSLSVVFIGGIIFTAVLFRRFKYRKRFHRERVAKNSIKNEFSALTDSRREHTSKLIGNNDFAPEGRSITITTQCSLLPNEKSYTVPAASFTFPTSLSANSYASLYKLPADSIGTPPALAGCHDSSHSPSCHHHGLVGLYPSSDFTSSSGNSSSYCSKESSKPDVGVGFSSALLHPSAESRNCLNRDNCSHCSKDNPITCAKEHSHSSQNSFFRNDLHPDPEMSEIKERFKQLQMERQRVRVTEVIQEGKFGRMFRGWLQREHPELDQQVLIKTTRDSSSHSFAVQMCQDGARMAGLRHPNLLTLVGISFAHSAPPFLIYPDPQGQNLKKFLLCSASSNVLLKMVDAAEILFQAANALSFLHTNNLVHKDVAARSFIVNTDVLHVRLCDSALINDFYPECFDPLTHVPIRWAAPEVLLDSRSYSALGDVWSLGVLMWEVMTRGQEPYPDIATEQILNYLTQGLRLGQPLTCPDDLYEIMTSCWSCSQESRPKSSKVKECLATFRQSLNSFV